MTRWRVWQSVSGDRWFAAQLDEYGNVEDEIEDWYVFLTWTDAMRYVQMYAGF